MHNISESLTKQIQHIDIHVGARVRSRRKALRMSQGALAAAIGLTFQQVQKYERGTNRISSSTLYMIARTLEAPVAWFFEGLTPPAEGAGHDLEAFSSTTEAMELMNAFLAIPTQGLRRRVVELMTAIGDGL